MDFIYTNVKFEEQGYLKDTTIDIEVGKYQTARNDFSITMSTDARDSAFDVGSLFYAIETEYGGIIESLKVSTSSNSITFKGLTFRGILTNEYIQPPNGQAYLVLKGNASDCIRQMIEGRFDELFVVDDSDVEINYDVRDLNLLQAIEKSLAKSNAKLEIKFKDNKVHLIPSPINDLSELVRIDNDLKVYMTVETEPKQYTHILALGSGELTERLRTNLYLQKNGLWSDIEIYTGLNRKTYKYENVNVDDLNELKTEAIEKINKLNGTNKLSLTLEGDEISLFDIVGAKEEITGISFSQQVTGKILKGNINNVKITYKVGD